MIEILKIYRQHLNSINFISFITHARCAQLHEYLTFMVDVFVVVFAPLLSRHHRNHENGDERKTLKNANASEWTAAWRSMKVSAHVRHSSKSLFFQCDIFSSLKHTQLARPECGRCGWRTLAKNYFAIYLLTERYWSLPTVWRAHAGT